MTTATPARITYVNTSCAHDRQHDGRAILNRKQGLVFYVLVCEDCDDIVTTIDYEAYKPQPKWER